MVRLVANIQVALETRNEEYEHISSRIFNLSNLPIEDLESEFRAGSEVVSQLRRSSLLQITTVEDKLKHLYSNIKLPNNEGCKEKQQEKINPELQMRFIRRSGSF